MKKIFLTLLLIIVVASILVGLGVVDNEIATLLVLLAYLSVAIVLILLKVRQSLRKKKLHDGLSKGLLVQYVWDKIGRSSGGHPGYSTVSISKNSFGSGYSGTITSVASTEWAETVYILTFCAPDKRKFHFQVDTYTYDREKYAAYSYKRPYGILTYTKELTNTTVNKKCMDGYGDASFEFILCEDQEKAREEYLKLEG